MIQLKPNAEPKDLYTARKVPLQLRDAVKAELKKWSLMESYQELTHQLHGVLEWFQSQRNQEGCISVWTYNH